MQGTTCKICDKGTLESKNKYRMSGPVVAIGYIFLCPSVLGMLFGVLLLFSTGTVTKDAVERKANEIRTSLSEAKIPEKIIEKIVLAQNVDETELKALTRKQKEAVRLAENDNKYSKAGMGLGAAFSGGLSIFLFISSFVGGLFGWILIMKKKILQCNNCSAVVQAS